ncbi:MAG: tetratricopeptide repeat protein [Cyanobacteria bacterium P01_A01_bin.114]
MKRRYYISLVLLVSTLICLSHAIRADGQPVLSPQLIAQHSDTAALQEADRLTEQADELYQQGQYAEAEPLYQRALQIREQSLGSAHLTVATSLNALAELYHDRGNYTEAEPLYQRALQIREQSLGASHPSVGVSLNNLAELYRAQGNYAEAEPLYQRALQIYAQTLDETHPNIAISLNNLAGLYRAQGNYAEAGPLYRRSLQIREQSLGPTHPSVATNLNNLAGLYHEEGNYTEAEPLYQRALQIYTQAFGETHSNVATSLNNLGALYHDQGNFIDAEPLYQSALRIREQSFGETHPAVATSLNNLGALYHDQGNYTEAAALYQRALQIDEHTFGTTHPNVATSLNNLAGIYLAQGSYTEAEPLYQRAFQINQQSFGEAHPNVATSLNNLAGLYRAQGKYVEAEPLYQRALQINQQSFDEAHPNVATSLNNLGVVYLAQGNYTEAELLLQRALQLREQTLSATHPNVAISLSNLGAVYLAQGRSERMLSLLSEQIRIEEANLAQVLSVGSDFRKQAYATMLQGSTFRSLSLAQQSPQSAQLTHLAFETILQRKGRVLDAVTDSNQRLRQNLSDQDKPLFDQLQAQRTQLANLLFNPLAQAETDRYRREVDSLKQQINQLENTLAQHSAEFRVEVEPVTVAAVQAQLPQDAALVEIIRYAPFDFEHNSWQPLRYAAYVLRADEAEQTVDLGDADTIDQAVRELRWAVRAPGLQIRPVARQLDALIMQPIRAQLGDANHLLLSPDGQLNLLPFAALIDEHNQYLIETYQITYLTSGRDLLRFRTSEPSDRPPVVMADPAYDRGAAAPFGPQSNSQPAHQRSIDAGSLIFADLPGTAEEANAIAQLLPDRTLLLDADATETALKQIQRPSLLHLATHGFFLQNLPRVTPPALEATQRGWGNSGWGHGPPQFRVQASQENPLLRAGLVFAGANQRQSGREDGILTALEAAGLDLRGTQLVVLSACDTGVGAVTNGEGIYGLRRSFVIAGAQSQLMSLWRVDDIGTKDLMVEYYEQLLSGQGRSDALRQTQLEMIRSHTYQHPYFWAAFISSGDWSPLEM